MSALRMLALTLLAFATLGAATAHAGLRLYSGSWVTDSFGNDKTGVGNDESEYFSITGIPLGYNCNPAIPICPLASTPVTNATASTLQFAPLGPDCVPITAFGTAVRPTKAATDASPPGTPPFYRNPAHFTGGGAPKTTACPGDETVGGSKATAFLSFNDPLRGKAMKGKPLTGSDHLSTTAPGAGNKFTFAAAGAATTAPGMRRTTAGSFYNLYPYLYSYTYATFRNDAGSFQAGGGWFKTTAAATKQTLAYFKAGGGGKQVATIKVKRGANRFGGVMKLLGQATTKVCYFYAGVGCALGAANWQYEFVGAAPVGTAAGVVTAGYTVTTTAYYYNTGGGTPLTYFQTGFRFPWTTGTVTVSATARGPHKTIVGKRNGYDNRTVSGSGTVQLVSPILTRWIGQKEFETGGVAHLKIFLPEPQKWMMLAAGLSLLGVLYHYRAR